MKTILRPLKAVFLIPMLVLTAPLVQAQSSGAISVDRSVSYTQTDATTITPLETPFAFTFNVRGGSVNMANWGPAFYKPGSGGTAQTGPSSETNTGTLNFPAVANNGTDYLFVHEFVSNDTMLATYPDGDYGVKFLGSSAPTPPLFTAGLVYSAGPIYPSNTPHITATDNDARWINGRLNIKPTGLTTLTLNSFPEYAATTYGSLIAAGIFDESGNVVHSASLESYYLPMGDSTKDPAPIVQEPITELVVNGAWFIPGKKYTLELQFAVIGGRPEEANLNGVEFQGVSSYRRVVTVSLFSGSGGADFNSDGQGDLVWENPANGWIVTWLMNGTSMSDYAVIGVQPGWHVSGNGDFNGDGRSDVVVQNASTGQVDIWLMNGTSRGLVVNVTTQPDWKVVSCGDFNGDGNSDLVWRNPVTGQIVVWIMNGTALDHYEIITTQPDWTIVGTGDFNGDGNSDLLWRNPTTGQVVVWIMNGTTQDHFEIITTQPDWNIAGTGDFNGDGASDLIWQHPSTGQVVAWIMNGTTQDHFEIITTQPDWKVVNR